VCDVAIAEIAVRSKCSDGFTSTLSSLLLLLELADF
jgi:hypothetical protein